MTKNKSISLSTKDLDSLISSLNSLEKDLSKFSSELCQDLAKQGLDKLNTLYSQRIRDDNITKISTKLTQKKEEYRIIASGKDVVYEEFGTGDKGEQSPHVEKEKYPKLNKYNSGKYIRNVDTNNKKLKAHGITSGKYWTYKKEGSDEVKYTQGVVAGMEMYKTGKYIRNNVRNTFEKKVSDVISKV